MTQEKVLPYGSAAGSKKQQVEQMFDNIAPTYDSLNHLLSLGIDVLWRRRAIRMLKSYKPDSVLDLATGTGDFAVEAARTFPSAQVTGMDISEGMLAVGRQKMTRLNLPVQMLSGDAEALPFADGSIAAITVGFGARNFEHLERGLAEMHRVLKPGGVAIILEPAVPTAFPFKQLFLFFFTKILPRIGKLLSKDSSAYTYLPESVRAFPNGAVFTDICKSVGYSRAEWVPLTFGICSLYLLEK